MKWNFAEASVFGTKGRARKSEAQRRASQQNGKAGGRPRRTTLAEFILRRKLTPEQHKDADEGYFRLSDQEKAMFRKFFGLDDLMIKVHYGSRRGIRKRNVHQLFSSRTEDGVRPTNPSKKMRMILRKFRITARYFLAGGR